MLNLLEYYYYGNKSNQKNIRDNQENIREYR